MNEFILVHIVWKCDIASKSCHELHVFSIVAIYYVLVACSFVVVSFLLCIINWYEVIQFLFCSFCSCYLLPCIENYFFTLSFWRLCVNLKFSNVRSVISLGWGSCHWKFVWSVREEDAQRFDTWEFSILFCGHDSICRSTI